MDRHTANEYAHQGSDNQQQISQEPLPPKKRGRGALKKEGVMRYPNGTIIPAYKLPPPTFTIDEWSVHPDMKPDRKAALDEVRSRFPIQQAKFYIRGVSHSAMERTKQRGEQPASHKSICWDDFAVAWLRALSKAGFSSREVALEMGAIGPGAVIRQAATLREKTGEVLFHKQEHAFKLKHKARKMLEAKNATRKTNVNPVIQSRSDAEMAAVRLRAAEFVCADDPSNAAAGLALLRALNAVPLPPIEKRVTLEQTVEKDTCRWIDGDPLGAHSYCGKPRGMPSPKGVRFYSSDGTERSPYCEAHQKVTAATTSTRPRSVS